MIQPLAYIHPQAKIAENVVIDPFVTIHKDVVIGETGDGDPDHENEDIREDSIQIEFLIPAI